MSYSDKSFSIVGSYKEGSLILSITGNYSICFCKDTGRGILEFDNWMPVTGFTLKKCLNDHVIVSR
jgi:hypothetical protein